MARGHLAMIETAGDSRVYRIMKKFRVRGRFERVPFDLHWKTNNGGEAIESRNPALAHTHELSGKVRLDKERYYGMQSIYDPGFTIGGGIGKAGGTISTIVLVFL